MSVTVTGFRQTYPEFVNDVQYTNYLIQPRLLVSQQLVSADRFGDLTDYAVYTRTAHMVALAAQNVAASKRRGGVVGQSVGPMSSKGAEGMSVSYETSAIMEKDGGYWNSTSYGREYWRLVQLFGVGPVQIGGPGGAVLTNWPGPGGYYPS